LSEVRFRMQPACEIRGCDQVALRATDRTSAQACRCHLPGQSRRLSRISLCCCDARCTWEGGGSTRRETQKLAARKFHNLRLDAFGDVNSPTTFLRLHRFSLLFGRTAAPYPPGRPSPHVRFARIADRLAGQAPIAFERSTAAGLAGCGRRPRRRAPRIGRLEGPARKSAPPAFARRLREVALTPWPRASERL
jgi:hypothetical protein